MKPKYTLHNLLALAGTSLLAATYANAALYFDASPTTADGASNGGTGVWDLTTQNWDNGSGYVAWNNGDDAVIAGNANLTVNTAVTVNTLTTVGFKKGYTVSGSEITINGGMTLVDLTSLNWSAPIKLGGDQTWVHDQVANSTGKTMSGVTNLNGHTLTWDTNSVKSNNSVNQSGGITGTGNIIKEGTGWARLGGTLDYVGTTTVNEGTLEINGNLSASTVTVSGGAIGGTGTITNGLNLNSGSFYIGNLNNALAVLGTTDIYAGFGVDDLDLTNITNGWADIGLGTYTLIDGELGAGVFAGLDNNSLGTAFDTGEGTFAYFQEGSLQLVVTDTIPEPSTALLGGLGLLALLRRRR